MVARERDRWEQLTQATFPSTARELAGTLAVLAKVATGPDRALVLARYALLIEAAQHEDVRPRLAAGGQRVNARVRAWMRLVGSSDPDHDMHVVAGVSDRVVALDHGVKIAEGGFDQVAEHPAVVEAYLGRAAQ